MEIIDVTHRGRRIVVSSTTLPNPHPANTTTVYQMTVEGLPNHGVDLPADTVIRALGQAMHAERNTLRHVPSENLIEELERRLAAGEIERRT